MRNQQHIGLVVGLLVAISAGTWTLSDTFVGAGDPPPPRAGAGAAARALTTPFPAPVFNTFGERAVVTAGSERAGAVMIVDLSAEGGGKVHVVSRGAARPSEASPRWSPDGARVAWSVGKTALIAGLKPDSKVEKIRLGRAITDFDPTSDWAVVGRGTYSPDGVKIAFVIEMGDGAGTFVAPVFGGATVRLSDEVASALAWDGAGKTVALALAESGIVVVGADGKGQRQLAPAAGEGPVALRFAKDGSRLLAFAAGRLRAHGLGEGATSEDLLKEDVAAVAASWSPSEDVLAVVTEEGFLAVTKAEGPLLRLSGATDRVISGPGWSPDGSRVAVLEFGGPGEVSLALRSPDGHDLERVALFWNASDRK